MNLLSQKTDSKCRQTTKTKSTHRRSIQTKMTCKDDEPMETTSINEENQSHHDDDDVLLHKLRQNILQEIEQSLQQITSREQLQQLNKKLVAPIHVSIAASKIETVPLKQKK
ncbi:unnamed protein product [Macrosiphum euphorbiae]|uniref:Uncharacterized protein n=1 Tax=Macrosiphum euphorbiae TaxID=13131 RepID=A0AAV0VXP2_9HEMI|nr:unnamed protein product [Macrosiphum euphorbiae]